MRVSILQTDIVWEDKQANLRLLHDKLTMLNEDTDLVVLPEMFSTGFSMNSSMLAEPVDGTTIEMLQQWAKEFGVAITGSFIAHDMLRQSGKPHCYNRAFFITPEGENHYYDKRHLFRMGSEPEHFMPGKNPRHIIQYRGWNILLLVCYDLRFPVWSRNINNEYDLLIYVANWPESRQSAWDTLLRARAIENQCYVCGVNRIGTDANNISYKGGSVIYSPKAEVMTHVPDNQEGISTSTLDLSALKTFRERFPVWKDADRFKLID